MLFRSKRSLKAMPRITPLTDALYDYMLSVSLREPDVLRRLREDTATRPRHGMQISPDQGQFMALLVELIGARKCLEIGTFTGYSALAVALALADDGTLIACDISEIGRAPGRERVSISVCAASLKQKDASSSEPLLCHYSDH